MIIRVFTNFQLVANQLTGVYEVKGITIVKYMKKDESLMEKFEKIEVNHVPQSENIQVDAFLKLTTSKRIELYTLNIKVYPALKKSKFYT